MKVRRHSDSCCGLLFCARRMLSWYRQRLGTRWSASQPNLAKLARVFGSCDRYHWQMRSNCLPRRTGSLSSRPKRSTSSVMGKPSLGQPAGRARQSRRHLTSARQSVCEPDNDPCRRCGAQAVLIWPRLGHSLDTGDSFSICACPALQSVRMDISVRRRTR